jgi:23S rRNA pseudouridine2605 synthase
VARVLSKRGYCSRSEAEALVRAGRVSVGGRVVRDPETPTAAEARILVDGAEVPAAKRLYLMLNKPRGLVTTVRDERGRETVYRCFDGACLPWLAPVGRLDKASEGLLLFSNDPEWAARITAPDTHLDKTYHVQIDVLPDTALLERLRAGVKDGEEFLTAKTVHELRRGDRQAWLEIVLDEGRNRHIRRLLDAHGIAVKRLVRVAIGELQLGGLAKGAWRELNAHESRALVRV